MSEKRTRGKPRKWKSGDGLLDLWREYCDWVVDDGFRRLPTQTGFCRWLEDNYEKADRKTIYNALHEYFPSIKSAFEQIQSDVLAEGAALGRYNATMCIFALKNWCKWTDKAEVAQDTRLEIVLPEDVSRYAD